jgi:hypothetical protein
LKYKALNPNPDTDLATGLQEQIVEKVLQMLQNVLNRSPRVLRRNNLKKKIFREKKMNEYRD